MRLKDLESRRKLIVKLLDESRKRELEHYDKAKAIAAAGGKWSMGCFTLITHTKSVGIKLIIIIIMVVMGMMMYSDGVVENDYYA